MTDSRTNALTQDADDVLRVARWKADCRVLGPGRRAVIWFQGCNLYCPGCIADGMNRSRDFRSYAPRALADMILGLPGIEGVTLTGGEPFQQPLGALAGFLAVLRQRSPLSVMCYSGYTLEELRAGTDAEPRRRVLEHIDLLVDGPYVGALNAGHRWRGSANQRLHFLTERYRHLAGTVEQQQERALEIELIGDHTLALAGIPEHGFMDRFTAQLERHGLSLELPPPAVSAGS